MLTFFPPASTTEKCIPRPPACPPLFFFVVGRHQSFSFRNHLRCGSV
jgi:hypothetical protein